MLRPLVSHSRSGLLHRSSLTLRLPSIKRLLMSCLFDNPPPSAIRDDFGFYIRTILIKQLFLAPMLIPYGL